MDASKNNDDSLCDSSTTTSMVSRYSTLEIIKTSCNHPDNYPVVMVDIIAIRETIRESIEMVDIVSLGR